MINTKEHIQKCKNISGNEELYFCVKINPFTKYNFEMSFKIIIN